MKKVLLVTLFDEKNIGNRLQNYALQRVIEGYGIGVTTLDNGYTEDPSASARAKYAVKQMLVRVGYRKYAEDCRKYRRSKGMRQVIRVFNRENLSDVLRVTNRQAFSEDWSAYDAAVAGSDQIWHKWRSDENELPYYYLQFMPPEKRVAYAASFGFEAFPEKDIPLHRAGIEGMKYISCREESGCGLIRELTGRQVPRVLDPTLLLSAEQWRELESQARDVAKKQENYALAFFLGHTSEEYRKYMERTMKERGVDKLIDFNGDALRECGPCEFLSLIDNARLVFTDSFHCTVFSTIFQKDFTVFRRVQPGFEKMFGRIEDLLASTDKLDRIYGGTSAEPTNNYEQLQKDSIRYLEMIFNIDHEN